MEWQQSHLLTTERWRHDFLRFSSALPWQITRAVSRIDH